MIHLAMLALALAACGSAPKSTVASSGSASGGDPTCPMEVPGTTVDSEATTETSALVFTTTGDVEAVRQRARSLAAMAKSGVGPPDAMGLMVKEKLSSVVAVDVPGGAKVIFTGGDTTAASNLQSDVPMHASHLVAGSCKMNM